MATRYSNWLRQEYNVYKLPMPRLPKQQDKDNRAIVFVFGIVAMGILIYIAYYFANALL